MYNYSTATATRCPTTTTTTSRRTATATRCSTTTTSWGSATTTGCATDGGRLYEGPARPRAELALVEVNRYAQKRTLRWVISEIRLADGSKAKTKQTFEIPSGDYRLEVDWRLYDTTEGGMTMGLLVPFADRAKRIGEGVQTIAFTPEAGAFYRLQWASRPDASLEPSPKDMELTLVAAGRRPELVAEPGE